jgi:hypothetical protein
MSWVPFNEAMYLVAGGRAGVAPSRMRGHLCFVCSIIELPAARAGGVKLRAETGWFSEG